MLTEMDKCYLAGAMDSDGWFCIKRVPPRPEVNRQNVTYYIFVGFCQTQDIVPSLLHEEFGGYLIKRHNKETRPKRKSNGWKPNFYWTATSKQACNVIKELLPYLRVKKAQAELCLKLDDSINHHRYSWVKSGQKGAKALPNNVIQQRTEIYEALAKLHDNRIIKRKLI